MTHGEDWDFIQVGKYLERADMTTRILDANDEIFINTPAKSQTGGTLQWSAILRSCSSHDAYRKFYVAQVEPDKVVEFLILNEFFPRSIRFCVQALDDALRRISGCAEERFTNQAEKLTGRLVAELNYSALEDIKTVGMHTLHGRDCRSSSTPSARPSSRPTSSPRPPSSRSRNRCCPPTPPPTSPRPRRTRPPCRRSRPAWGRRRHSGR